MAEQGTFDRPTLTTREIVVVAAVSVLLAVAICLLGTRQFGGMDMSAAINGAHRWMIGQRPYTDFLSVAPPSYMIGGGIAFKLFGLSWWSIILLTAIYSAAILVIQHVAFRWLGLGWIGSLLLTLAIHFTTMIPAAFWTYNQVTSVSGALYATCAILVWKRPRCRTAWGLFLFSMVQLSWMKPNVAGLLFLGTGPALLLNRETRIRYLAVTLGAASISVLALVAAGVNPAKMLDAYFASSGRVFNMEVAKDYLYRSNSDEATPSWIASIPLWLVYFWRLPGLAWRSLGLFWFSLLFGLTSVAAMATNNEYNQVELPLFFVGVGLAAWSWSAVVPSTVAARIRLALFVLGVAAETIFGAHISVTRWRIRSIGPEMFFQDAPLTRLSSPVFFDGIWGSPRFVNTLREMREVLAKVDPAAVASGSVFFGPRIEFGYAAWNIAPVTKTSLWWMGTGEGTPDQHRLIHNTFLQAQYRLCIFLKNDYTFMPWALIHHLNSPAYERIETPNLTIHRRRM